MDMYKSITCSGNPCHSLPDIDGFVQGREISLWPPRIGGKPLILPIDNSIYSPANVLDAIKMRKSVRSFLGKPVEDEKLNLILESARMAPSASNHFQCDKYGL
jgi:hypothetical protein